MRRKFCREICNHELQSPKEENEHLFLKTQNNERLLAGNDHRQTLTTSQIVRRRQITRYITKILLKAMEKWISYRRWPGFCNFLKDYFVKEIKILIIISYFFSFWLLLSSIRVGTAISSPTFSSFFSFFFFSNVVEVLLSSLQICHHRMVVALSFVFRDCNNIGTPITTRPWFSFSLLPGPPHFTFNERTFQIYYVFTSNQFYRSFFPCLIKRNVLPDAGFYLLILTNLKHMSKLSC